MDVDRWMSGRSFCEGGLVHKGCRSPEGFPWDLVSCRRALPGRNPALEIFMSRIRLFEGSNVLIDTSGLSDAVKEMFDNLPILRRTWLCRYHL